MFEQNISICIPRAATTNDVVNTKAIRYIVNKRLHAEIPVGTRRLVAQEPVERRLNQLLIGRKEACGALVVLTHNEQVCGHIVNGDRYSHARIPTSSGSEWWNTALPVCIKAFILRVTVNE